MWHWHSNNSDWWSNQQVLDSKILDPSCNLYILYIFAPVDPLAFSISEMTSWQLHVWNTWEMSFPAATSSVPMWSKTWNKLLPFLYRGNKLLQNLNIKKAVYKALLNGCKAKPTCSLHIKPLQAFHAWCLQGILEIRCNFEKGNKLNSLAYTS